jgi:hypothetical protein
VWGLKFVQEKNFAVSGSVDCNIFVMIYV